MKTTRTRALPLAGAALVAGVLLGPAAPAHAKPGAKQIAHSLSQLRKHAVDDLVDAAAGAGVKVDPRSVVTLQGNGASAVLGAVAGLGSVPESAVPKGINLAYGYFDFPQGKGGSPIPPGLYTIRVTASQADLDASYKQFRGTIPDPGSLDDRVDTPDNARAEFIDAQGRVVLSLPCAVDVWARGAEAQQQQRHLLTTVEPLGYARGFGFWVVTNSGMTWCFTCPWFFDA